MEVTHEEFLGYACLRLSNQRISIWLTEDFGLRLIGLALAGGDNVLAYAPEGHIEVAGGEDYFLRGGHRLWYGPEVPETTYLPDNRPVDTSYEAGVVEQRQPVDESTGVEKMWRVQLVAESARLSIEHQLTNRGTEPITLAPWAITMLKPGGLGIFPQPVGLSDPHGLQPNRHVVLWPYTPVQSEFIQWQDDGIFVRAALKESPLKIGFPNPAGWLAYLYQDQIFVKRTKYDPTATYIDRGASSQVYCSPDVIELETLGPQVQLQPGQKVEHHESWELTPADECRAQVRELYDKYFGG
jgi:hypothetical protein